MKLFYISLIATLLSSTITSTHSFLIIGHRGACGYEPENTLSSFQKALDMQVDMIELDVYVCKTGELVVMHDDTVDRTTNGHGNVTDMTFQELRNLKISNSEKIPTLKEVIELINHKVVLNIELKGPQTAKPVAKLLQKYLASGWITADFVVSSFDHAQIQIFQKLCPNIKTGALFSLLHNPKTVIEQAIAVHADFVGIDNALVSSSLIHDAHAHDLPVYVFTINTQFRADELNDLGIDGIFSNYPDLVIPT